MQEIEPASREVESLCPLTDMLEDLILMMTPGRSDTGRLRGLMRVANLSRRAIDKLASTAVRLGRKLQHEAHEI